VNVTWLLTWLLMWHVDMDVDMAIDMPIVTPFLDHTLRLIQFNWVVLTYNFNFTRIGANKS
jgi:hypothetical protein